MKTSQENKRFGWLRERAAKKMEKTMEVVNAYQYMRGLTTMWECKRELSRRTGISEIRASTIMAWVERYGFEYCVGYCTKTINSLKGGEA